MCTAVHMNINVYASGAPSVSLSTMQCGPIVTMRALSSVYSYSRKSRKHTSMRAAAESGKLAAGGLVNLSISTAGATGGLLMALAVALLQALAVVVLAH